MNYTLTRVALGASLIAVTASCSGVAGEPRLVGGEPLAASATVAIDSNALRTLVVTVRIANRSSTDQPISWQDDCLGNGTTEVQLFRGTTLVWDLAKARPIDDCPLRAIQSVLAAHDTGGFGAQIPLNNILGDSLVAGPYTIVAAPIMTSPASPSIGAADYRRDHRSSPTRSS